MNTAKILSIIVIALSLTGCAAIFPSEAVQLARIEAEVARHDRDARSAEARATVIEFTSLSCTKASGEPCVLRASASASAPHGKVRYGFLDGALDGVINFGIVSKVIDKIR